MKHLTADQLAELQKQMEHRLASLEDYYADIEETDPTNQVDRDEYNESGDDSVENYEILESESLSETAGDLISELKAGLQRMESGTYGVDEVTGEPIPFDRLQLFPEARTNVDTTDDDDEDE